MRTYNITFNNSDNSNDKGFELSIEDAKSYIKQYNGTNESYFADYKGGIVQVIDNENGAVVYEEEIF